MCILKKTSNGGNFGLLKSAQNFRVSLVPNHPRRFQMSAVKLVGKIRTWFQSSSGGSDIANWPGYTINKKLTCN